ncbi:MAG: sirohydrochlorin cobaltochelatase, partial [Oscillibacter sp.]|nr:sirohydrochlorin cobaltochelatase [Oscillibacter sp.]
MKRKTIFALLSLAAILTLCACAAAPRSDGTENTDAVEAADSAEEADDMATGDAALDNPRNQDGIGERELLAVSFGTSYNDARRLSIGGVEDALEAAFPDWSVRRGFTSQIVLDHVAKRDGVSMDNVSAALNRAVSNGVKYLVVQPTHLMDGFEYHDLAEEVEQYADAFANLSMGAPLLTSDDDFARVAEAVRASTAEYDDGDTAICLMGHGTEAASNAVYGRMQEEFAAQGMDHYYLGTVEAEPSLEDLLEAVKAGSYTKV